MGPDTPTAVAAPSTPDAPRISARVPDVSTGEPGGEVRAVKMPLVDRIASAVVTGAPPILVLLGMWLGWNHGLLVWQDLLVLAVFYMFIGTGITVGFHRLLTHRSFRPHPVVRAVLLVLGSRSFEGSAGQGAATHLKHHALADRAGDPHSPVQGFVQAHLGWICADPEADPAPTPRPIPRCTAATCSTTRWWSS